MCFVELLLIIIKYIEQYLRIFFITKLFSIVLISKLIRKELSAHALSPDVRTLCSFLTE